MKSCWNYRIEDFLLLVLVALIWWLIGCTPASFSLIRPPTSQPAEPESINQIAAAIANLLQVEIEPDVSGWTGIGTGIAVEYALPWSFMPLMAFLMWLSHRRAMRRIQHNGHSTMSQPEP